MSTTTIPYEKFITKRDSFTAIRAVDKYSIEKLKDIAAMIKKELDQRYGLTWHCIVGKNFGSYVTHETKHFIYFYIGPVAILVFKTA